MALERQHQIAFEKECSHLSFMVLGSLQKLASNPTDIEELHNLVQAADTIMGDARFLQDKELEQSATMIVKSFDNIRDVRKRIDEYSTVCNQFGKMIARTGVCPKGYKIVNGTCVLITNDKK